MLISIFDIFLIWECQYGNCALADKWGLSWILMILGILLLFFVAGWNWRWGNVIISMAQKSGQRELEDIEDI